MGALALDDCIGSSLVLDVGGTTTDMFVILDGIPLLEPLGIRLGPYQTLIRSLLTRSIGIGGDSEVKVDRKGNLKIGPVRQGPPAAFGGPEPTPTDAMVVLGMLKSGDPRTAARALEKIGGSFQWDPETTAAKILRQMGQSIARAVEAFVHSLNARPVYTIHEVLEEKPVAPDSVVLIGGPAVQLASYVEEALCLPTRVPPHAEVANAVGAALSRTTAEIHVQADTGRRVLNIPEADVHASIEPGFSIVDAANAGREALARIASEIGAETSQKDFRITEEQVFNMIEGYSRTGQNIRMTLSIMPGLISSWNRGDCRT
jgi:N-methylhydantoinase A/oxoprolinase/acetone carboxylase beta subunit